MKQEVKRKRKLCWQELYVAQIRMCRKAISGPWTASFTRILWTRENDEEMMIFEMKNVNNCPIPESSHMISRCPP
jgi:hypothetical protein